MSHVALRCDRWVQSHRDGARTAIVRTQRGGNLSVARRKRQTRTNEDKTSNLTFHSSKLDPVAGVLRSRRRWNGAGNTPVETKLARIFGLMVAAYGGVPGRAGEVPPEIRSRAGLNHQVGVAAVQLQQAA